ELSAGDRSIRGAVWITPGQAENSVTLQLGYGRQRVGRVGNGVGFNVNALRTSHQFWSFNQAKLTKTAGHHHLVATQTHHQLGSPERQIYRAGKFNELLTQPDAVKRSLEEPRKDETLYDENEHQYTGYRWGMSIDLTTCIGCNACV